MEELEALTGSQGLRDDIRSLAAPLRRLIAWYGSMHCFPAAKPMVLLEPFWSTLQKWDLSVIQCEEATLKLRHPHQRNSTLSDGCHQMLRGEIGIDPGVRAMLTVEGLTLSPEKVHPDCLTC